MGHIYIRGKMDFDVTLYHAWVIQKLKGGETGESFWAFIGYLAESVKFWKTLGFMSWQKKFSWKVVVQSAANMNVLTCLALEVVNWFMALAILTGLVDGVVVLDHRAH